MKLTAPSLLQSMKYTIFPLMIHNRRTQRVNKELLPLLKLKNFKYRWAAVRGCIRSFFHCKLQNSWGFTSYSCQVAAPPRREKFSRPKMLWCGIQMLLAQGYICYHKAMFSPGWGYFFFSSKGFWLIVENWISAGHSCFVMLQLSENQKRKYFSQNEGSQVPSCKINFSL